MSITSKNPTERKIFTTRNVTEGEMVKYHCRGRCPGYGQKMNMPVKRYKITFKGILTVDADSKTKAYAKALDALNSIKVSDGDSIVGTGEIQIKELPF